jgi:hypothetical protein
MTGTLEDLEVAAALAEEIYRRNAKDQPIQLGDIANSKDDSDVVRPPSLTKDPSGFYYDDATGFVGQVVDANGKIFVVFRGTDLGSLTDFDSGDIDADGSLAAGTTARSQLDDALALTRAAIAAAGGDASKVVVTGQSLGGGLAGLVSGLLNVKSYLFDPAPFANQFNVIAGAQALVDSGLTSPDDPFTLSNGVSVPGSILGGDESALRSFLAQQLGLLPPLDQSNPQINAVISERATLLGFGVGVEFLRASDML